MASVIEFYVAGEDSNGSAMDADNTIDRLAQSFTIGTTGTNTTFNLSSVNIKIFKTGTPGNLSIEIHETFNDGTPKGTAISSGTIAVGSVGTVTGTWYEISMSTATLKANGKYAIVLSATTSTGNTYNWRVDAGGGYAGGNTWENDETAGEWAATAGDAMFEIVGGDYAGTLCTLADAINKAGANASAIGSNETLVSNFVRQAEGTIAAVTKFDWVDAYASISDDVKYILNDVASNLAAIYIISYDMSGYTADTVEAETMINVYRESIARGLSLLKDQEVKDFITGDA